MWESSSKHRFCGHMEMTELTSVLGRMAYNPDSNDRVTVGPRAAKLSEVLTWRDTVCSTLMSVGQ